jgi:ATPase subunit of ABC transporter with duplicated ATPase domains
VLTRQSLNIYRNDRIALFGANGCGKTTLMKMTVDEQLPDSGQINVSVNAKTAYMPQIIEFENGSATVLDTLRSDTGITEEKARGILAGFHFGPGDVMKKVNVLSGGEKSRLKLCLMMQRDVNFLLLDEPTNHLDIMSREWIENALGDFEGTMLFVSHDRYFLNKFAEKVWSMENGVITEYNCGFNEYLEITRPAEEQKNYRRM